MSKKEKKAKKELFPEGIEINYGWKIHAIAFAITVAVILLMAYIGFSLKN